MSEPSTNAAFGAAPRSRRPIFVFDGTRPSVQTFPASAAEALAITGRTFTAGYRFDQASGAPTTVGSIALTAVGSQLFQRTMPVWDGSSMIATKGVEFLGTSTGNYFVSAGSTSDFDLSQSLTFVMCARVLRVGGNRALLGKQALVGSAGYRVIVTTAAGGPFTTMCHNGTTSTEAAGPVSAANEIDAGFNGSMQWWAFKFDLTGRTQQVLGHRAAGTPVAMPSGTFTNAAYWHLGGLPFYFDPDTLQVAWLGVLTGAEAEAFDLTALNTLDNVARTPSAFATYSRNSCVAPQVAYEAGFGTRLTTYHGSASANTVCHFPHAYHTGATLSTQQLGAWFGRGPSISGGNKRNQYTRTDDLSHADWTKTNVTASANAAEDPMGFKCAAQLTASSANGTISQTKTVTANRAYVHSFYVRRVGGSDVSLVLRAVDMAGPTTITSTAATATSEWTRISLLSQSATATSVRYELEIVTNGASIYSTCAQVEYGWLTPYQPQHVTLLDRADATHYVDNTARLYDPVAGTVEVWACQYHDNMIEDAYVFSTSNSDGYPGTADKDRMLIQTSDASGSTGAESEAYDLDVIFWDTSSAIWARINAGNIDRSTERKYSVQWDKRQAVPKLGAWVGARQDAGAWDLVGATVPAAAPSHALTMPRIYIGAKYLYDAAIEGIVQRVVITGRQ